jgi:two-component system nitrogen regulation sensor histidine kinase NtrY
VALIGELFYTLTKTNRVVGSLLESVRTGDMNVSLGTRAEGLGFSSLSDAAQGIISAIASARIAKETQYRYLQAILEHIHTAVLTLDEKHEPELINPLALQILGIHHLRNPSWGAIEKASPVFAKTVLSMENGGREMVRPGGPEGKQILILVNRVRLAGRQVKIVTFQDIEPEIERKELESWQTISRIMAHEIMNSLTPLSSLTETGIMLLKKDGRARKMEELTQDTIDNLYTALTTISDRNAALSGFIDSYRQLWRLPDPEPEELSVAGWLNETLDLYCENCREKGISLDLRPCSPNLRLRGDGNQLRQVLINLIKNAMEALEGADNGEIAISAGKSLDYIFVEISDNGPGIPPDQLDRIFIPFYSTKQGGSGIGLSLSRQIIKNHGGHLTVRSAEGGKGTLFRFSVPSAD